MRGEFAHTETDEQLLLEDEWAAEEAATVWFAFATLEDGTLNAEDEDASFAAEDARLESVEIAVTMEALAHVLIRVFLLNNRVIECCELGGDGWGVSSVPDPIWLEERWSFVNACELCEHKLGKVRDSPSNSVGIWPMDSKAAAMEVSSSGHSSVVRSGAG